MVVTATQFKKNIGHYPDTVSENKVVYIIKNGKKEEIIYSLFFML